MVFLYNLGIKLYNVLLHVAQFFNPKARQWVAGRKDIFKIIKAKVDPSRQHIWFHFASLGEFEQGRPVLEDLKKQYPSEGIIITFFSPSGYELRKNYALADHVFYLPIDTASNAERFIELTNPKLAVFTKYEYWFHYFKALHRNSIPLLIISAIFRKDQPFFKWYGSFNRATLRFVTHFFVQDASSIELLNSIGLKNATISGDTRFDRVAENAAAPKQFAQVESFCSGSPVFIAGSTWPEDEKLIAGVVKSYPDWKFVIAPHEIKDEKIKALEAMLPQQSSVRYSKVTSVAVPNTRVLIIDNIGMLSALYQYGHIAFIGGGFGVGIHNTLEAAAFGIPVIFGPNYHKFLEAKALIKNGGGYSISNATELEQTLLQLQDDAVRNAAGKAAGDFVKNNKGATGVILGFIAGLKLGLA